MAVVKAAPPHAAAATRQDVGRGIALMLLAVGLFAIMDSMIKWVGSTYPTMQVVFFRNLFAFIPLAVLIFRGGLGPSLRITSWSGHLMRSITGLVAAFCFFYGFAHLPLADVIALSFAVPIVVTALSVPLLGEKVGVRRWSAVVVGFVGVLVIVDPGGGIPDTAMLVPLFGVVFYALAVIYVRKLSRSDSSASIVFYYTLFCVLVSGSLLPFNWVTPSVSDLVVLVLIGVVGGVAQIIFTMAFREADVAVLAPFEYSAMIWAVVIGYVVWSEVPGLNIWIGVAIVMASGLYILFREANLGLPRGIARRLQPKR